MELSHEDNLRLNVLLNQDLRAVRIDESAMIVHALTGRGEAKVQLNPNCRDDVYVRRIRELLSTHALGSPGGYPVFLKRWTRMGQMRDQNLDSLLVLGEPEAVMAVAYAGGLTEELARRAWWVMPTAEVARKMLESPSVAGSDFGRELANFLIEFLPFESEGQHVVESVRLVLQPGLIDDNARQSLWKKALRKSAYYVGFLCAGPGTIPETVAAHPRKHEYETLLRVYVEQDDPVATQFATLLSEQGQSYLLTIEKAIEKIADQEVMVLLLKAIQNYFHKSWPQAIEAACGDYPESIDQKISELLSDLSCCAELQRFINGVPQLQAQLAAMLKMSLVGEPLVNPIFSQTDSVGSVMRKRLRPVTDWLLENVAVLKQ